MNFNTFTTRVSPNWLRDAKWASTKKFNRALTSLGLLLFKLFLDETLRSSKVETFIFPSTAIQLMIARVHNPNNPCKEIVKQRINYEV